MNNHMDKIIAQDFQLPQSLQIVSQRHSGASEGKVVAHPGKHFIQLKRLGDVVSAADGKAAYLGACFGKSGEENDRDVFVLRISFELSAEFKSVHFGH